MKCIKCFRKLGIDGNVIKINKNIQNILEKYPIKMATSTVYSCQKSGYNKSENINKYINLDLVFLERYYINYLYPAHNEVHLVPTIFKECITNTRTCLFSIIKVLFYNKSIL